MKESFTKEETEILKTAGYVLFKRTENGGIVGLYLYMYSLGLQNHIEVSEVFNEYEDRYCYPIKTTEMMTKAIKSFNEWDGVSTPSAGWVKYKGRKGERYPELSAAN